jgi:uncharacterized protein
MHHRRTVLASLACGLGLAFGAAARAADGAAPAHKVGDRLAAVGTAPPAGEFKLTNWDALVPKDWDPLKEFKGLSLGMLRDDDPRGQEVLDRMRHAWDKAPTEASMDNQRIRIAGFVVPLEGEGSQLREFLLVPYFGACIHVPPPPANQIIHVTTNRPIAGVHAMDALWVSGRLHVAVSDTAMGTSGYRMEAESTSPYREKR